MNSTYLGSIQLQREKSSKHSHIQLIIEELKINNVTFLFYYVCFFVELQL